MGGGALFLAVFLACVVEAVEALTIVLAAGTGRDWRSAITGVVSGLVVLAVVVAVLGPALTLIPLATLRLVVGGLLLIFGLQWLRKAIMRASGLKALHDEDAIFATEFAAAQAVPAGRRGVVADWYSFTLSFKGVVLEGLEVAFIALTFGANQQNIPLAAVAALAAVLVVAAAGIAVRAPLARVPENTLKFIVGIMLTSFGIFWGAEGAGALWPGRRCGTPGRNSRGGAVRARARRTAAQSRCAPHRGTNQSTGRLVNRVSAIFAFWYDFIVGDDWRVAVGVIVGLVATYGVSTTAVPAWWVLPAAVVLLLPLSLWRVARSRAKADRAMVERLPPVEDEGR